MNNSLRRIWQENGPVEAEDYGQQQGGHHHPVDFLKAAHSTADGQGCHHKDNQHAQNGQATLLVVARNTTGKDVHAWKSYYVYVAYYKCEYFLPIPE